MRPMTPRVVLAIAATYLAVTLVVIGFHVVLGIDAWYFHRACCAAP